MCGIIAGQLNHIIINNIQKSLHKISHRGPDGQSYKIIDPQFLGHTRLSIVDIEFGQQPLSNEDNTIYAVVNGEFYCYEALKKQLILDGHIFKTNSDSEILIHSYEKYGTNCLNYLHGEFSFVLYDKNKKRWFCARDRIGVRPLQYFFNKDTFLISSEAKALFEFNVVNPEINRESFWFSQHLQYLPLNQTLFKNIHMIKPGHFLIINESEEPKEILYWDIKNIHENKELTFNDVKEKSIDLIEKAVIKRLPKEVVWSTHLSGGIDSSIISYLAHQNNPHIKKSFNIEFTDNPFYNESILAQETANFLNINLIKIPVNINDIVNYLPTAIYHAEGTSINGHISAKYILNKTIKEHNIKVALTGEGADEIFMGYSHLKQDYLNNNALEEAEKMYLNGIQLPDGETLDLSAIYDSLGFIPTWISAKASMAHKLKQLWHKDFHLNINPYELIVKDLEGYSSHLKSSSFSWTKYCLNGYILKTLDDAQSMAHGIESRLPFLDTDLMEYMFSVPDHIYFHQNVEKGLLREGFKNKLPKNIIKKTKQSFMAPPINQLLEHKSLQNLILEYIFDNHQLKDLSLFDLEKLHRLIKTDQKNNVSFEPILMSILTTGIFIKKFL